MKKLLSIFLIGLMSISMFACSFVKPEDKVNEFLGAVKSKDEQVLMGYTDNKYVNMLVNPIGNKKVLNTIYNNLFKNMTYKIVSVTDNDTGSIVKVEITNVSFKKAFRNYEKKSYDYMIKNLYSESISKVKMNKKCLNILSKEIANAAKSKKKIKKTVDITLLKNENHSYDIKINTKLMDLLMGGIISESK